MSDKNEVKLGDGVIENIISAANQEVSEIGKMLVKVFSDFLKKKIQGINFDDLFSPKNQEELVRMWSVQLAEKGLIAKEYGGLTEELLIDSLHQDGFSGGLYVGYVLAMMSLVDNEAEKELIVSVRDDIRPNLIGHHFNDRDEFYEIYKGERYSWVETMERKSDK